MKYMNMTTYEISDYAPRCNENGFCEIDDNIADAIAMLNKKGYYTAFCCSGHMDSGHNPEVAYIQFEFGGFTPEELPDGWEYVQDGQMEYAYLKNTQSELSAEIKSVMTDLLRLAVRLPEVT